MDDWGGSEELWARGLGVLMKKNVEVTVYKKKINFAHPQIQKLAAAGMRLCETDPPMSVARLRMRKASGFITRAIKGTPPERPLRNADAKNFGGLLRSRRPDLAVIAQGINFDGMEYARVCLQLDIPFVLIVQKAVDYYWPQAYEKGYMSDCFRKAEKCFFVSRHNLRLTEEQFGMRLSNAAYISNPLTLPPRIIPFPASSARFSLACVARLFIQDKGQDMLLRILSTPKWRSRPLRVSLAGTGTDEASLRGLAGLLKLENVDFLGHVTDLARLWAGHHALVLPSRSEGQPLSVLEAMAAGRPAIVSNAGGNGEIVEDGVTGFVGEACESSFEEAMERAWARRNEWEDMGREASRRIGLRITEEPEVTFAKTLNRILYDNKQVPI
jgi:glycosyltransferase involved in cell wall biosynthesis